MILKSSFLDKYPDKPNHITPIGEFTYLRTYSRFLSDKGRRETWKETVARAVSYNIGLEEEYRNMHFGTVNNQKLTVEAEELFDSIFNLKQFPSGRTLWVGGADTGVAEKFPLSNFNCSFTNIEQWEDLAELFYLLLVGTGVGFRCTKEMAKNLPPIRNNIEMIHLPYNLKAPANREEFTIMDNHGNSTTQLTIHVGDSKEGWVEALRLFFEFATLPSWQHIQRIIFCYDSIRPRGERLKTFGGTASGYEPLQEMFEGINKVLNNQLDEHLEPVEVLSNSFVKVRPIHILDIGNLIGYNVVVGGVKNRLAPH